ncbi:Glycoside hydrolase family 18 protein [Ceratobasidium theobromae]|uniref:chitinase n=1 Tax=Ceratobasidium theobromae TaxID=1582974 RepID=A0A5N5QDE5_9AGAM|nr:Glycoside hydrolase family 18 protein [Ceratobasidium theobromae]
MHFLSLAMALGAALSVSATQIHHRPEDYLVKKLPHTPPSNRTVAPQKVHERRATIERRANGKVNMAYYTNWSIYARAFYPQNIDASKLTHILYGFADCDATTGQVTLTDLNADQLKLYDDDNSSEGGTNLYGNLKQLYLMKQKNRSLKVMLTIGGFTYSQEGHFNFITSSSARATFISSAITIMEDNGLDGIDIDFEFPTAGAQAQGYASLLSELRTALNSHAAKKGETNPYQITAAVPAGSDNYTKLLVSQMDPSLTFWNLMAYDYSGDWSSAADDQANLYGPTTTGFDTNTAIQWYTANGATASKIALGMPIYGRSFENTGGRGQSYSGVGTGTWDSGVYDYKALPLSGAVVYEDSSRGSSYSYDSSKREWVSYDTPNIIRQKAAYAVSKGLAGGMFWELSADKTGSESLVGASASSLGSLDSTPNHLYYPYSKFDNVKNNMGQGTVLPTTSAQVTSTTTTKTTTQVATTTTTTSAAATTTASTGGGCSGLSAWRSDIAYVGGDVVTYNGHKWTAQWWNQAELPGGASGVWTDNGAC